MNLTSAQALSEDLQYLGAAYAGYIETLEQLFGTGKDETINTKIPKNAKGEELTISPVSFDAIFGDGNKMPRRKLN